MDHWGDPWADDADNLPPKQEVTAPPLTTTSVPAPVVLKGFLDDAQWGRVDDEGFGAWASSPRKPGDGDVASPSQTRVESLESATCWDHSLDFKPGVSEEEDEKTVLAQSNEWDAVATWPTTPKEGEHVVSEASDSATTIQPDDVHTRIDSGRANSMRPDDDASTRPSTSPSDVSHNEAITESPRTSFEDERAATMARMTDKEGTKAEKPQPVVEDSHAGASVPAGEEPEDDFGDFEEDVAQEPSSDRLQVGSVQKSLGSPRWSDEKASKSVAQELEPAHAPPLPTLSAYSLDTELLAQLFPAPQHTTKLEEAPDGPLHSTSTRKAWYRLARKQTMREFNSGNDNDNYIRVTWKISHIRNEINNIVARWASEDRIAGRGPGVRASFYWDTPASLSQPHAGVHSRKKSTVSTSKPADRTAPAVQPLSTDVPAAFNWSSPAAAHSLPGWRSTSSPTTAQHTAFSKVQKQETRAASVDLTPRPREPENHKRTSTATELLIGIPSVSQPLPLSPHRPSEHVDPWANLSSLDTSNPAKAEPSSSAENDDDEWGEMVESPAVSAVQTPIAELSESSTRNNTLVTPLTTPKSVKSSPLQPIPMSTGPKHASPIVRLKGTVSPTSALFKPSAFVPASVEQGPIGPGILKSRNRSSGSTPEKRAATPEPVAQIDEVLAVSHAGSSTKPEAELETPAPPARPNPQMNEEDSFSSFETSQPVATPPQPPVAAPPPSAIEEPDFSIFDSPPPPAIPISSCAAPDPSDPWSIFDSPAPPSPAPEPEPAAPFVRPEPRPVTPPPKQPLTGATNSAQRRKAEEDEMIRRIVEGLPDLGYMLSR